MENLPRRGFAGTCCACSSESFGWEIVRDSPMANIVSQTEGVICRLGAVYKSGTGTRGWGHRDACVGTWDLGTRDEGLEDIKYGTRGRVGRGRGDVKNRDAGDAGCE